MLFSDMIIWKFLWLFWLIGLPELVLTFPIIIQSLYQIAGLIYINVKHKPFPNKDNYNPKVLYSLPFEERWIVVNGGVSKETSHSWNVITQRYAYDFIMLDKEGKSFLGNGTSLSDYYCYEMKILAPADGVVVEIKNSLKDSKVIGNGRTDPLIKDIRGNYVVIQHSDNEYSCLAHLKPESILVSVGQTVNRKQPIALCGNSGNTSEPHLHFQVQNGKSFFTSVGLPIHFQSIQTESYSNYFLYDNRLITIESGTNNTFISRGLCVNNT